MVTEYTGADLKCKSAGEGVGDREEGKAPRRLVSLIHWFHSSRLARKDSYVNMRG